MAVAAVNGLEMYYEVHGSGRPLVLLHGAMSTIETSFASVLPALAETRQVIAIEQQAHGHTPDIDRPLSYAQMATDTVAVLRDLELEEADFYGYSMGAGIALEIGLREAQLVGKLVLASLSTSKDGFHPEIVDEIEAVSVDDLAGSSFEEAYARTAPDPQNWPGLVAKCNELDRGFSGWGEGEIASLQAPVLLIVGDSDIVRPEHAVELFRLLGGGVEGDSGGLPRSRLAVLPGTTHLAIVDRAEWLVSMILAFLNTSQSKGENRGQAHRA